MPNFHDMSLKESGANLPDFSSLLEVQTNEKLQLHIKYSSRPADPERPAVGSDNDVASTFSLFSRSTPLCWELGRRQGSSGVKGYLSVGGVSLVWLWVGWYWQLYTEGVGAGVFWNGGWCYPVLALPGEQQSVGGVLSPAWKPCWQPYDVWPPMSEPQRWQRWFCILSRATRTKEGEKSPRLLSPSTLGLHQVLRYPAGLGSIHRSLLSTELFGEKPKSSMSQLDDYGKWMFHKNFF